MPKITLKAARVNVGLTQDDAAKLIGVNTDTLGKWERGQGYPNVIQLENIIKAYGVPYEQLNFMPNTTVKA